MPPVPTSLPSGGVYTAETTIMALMIVVTIAGLLWALHSQGKRDERRTDRITDGLERLGDRLEKSHDKIEAALHRQDERADARHQDLTRYLNGRAGSQQPKPPESPESPPAS